MPNKKTAAQRQPYVDAMKGFGILCVVIGHFIEYHRGTAPGINALFTCIYLFHMAIFCTASGLVAKFSLRKLVTQQLWLYLISQAGITAFRAAALKDNIVDQGGWLQNVLLPWRHMWYLYALMFWMLTVPLLRAIQRRGLLASTVGMAAAIAIGLLGGCVNWPFDLGRVFSFFPFFAFGVLFAEPFRSWQKRWYAWGPLAAAIVVFYTVTVQRIVTAETPVYEGARIFQSDACGGRLPDAGSRSVLPAGLWNRAGHYPHSGAHQAACQPGPANPAHLHPAHAAVRASGSTWLLRSLCFPRSACRYYLAVLYHPCGGGPVRQRPGVCHPERHCKHLVQNAPGSLFPPWIKHSQMRLSNRNKTNKRAKK